jgi:hypothetical protein
VKVEKHWLRFSDNYLRNSGNEFLERFGTCFEEGYKSAEQADYVFKRPSLATEQQIPLKEIFDFEAFRTPSMWVRGYALIGKTDFSKLEFVKNYLTVCGLSEFTGDETEGRYAIVDCSGIKSITD